MRPCTLFGWKDKIYNFSCACNHAWVDMPRNITYIWDIAMRVLVDTCQHFGGNVLPDYVTYRYHQLDTRCREDLDPK